jgi:hypothetical protein
VICTVSGCSTTADNTHTPLPDSAAALSSSAQTAAKRLLS